jgi:hypothetical protein
MPHRPKLAIELLPYAVLFLAVVVLTAAAVPAVKDQKQLADSMEKKIAAVRDNGKLEHPRRQTVVFAQEEINAYFAERRLKMPDGIRSVTFALKKDQVFARARIDFDEITRERRSQNPLMYLFSGTHNVDVVATATSISPGMVHVRVESVVINGVTVPKMALQFFIDRFVHPKYPDVGLDNDYRLAAKMDSVVIGERKGTVTQK